LPQLEYFVQPFSEFLRHSLILYHFPQYFYVMSPYLGKFLTFALKIVNSFVCG